MIRKEDFSLQTKCKGCVYNGSYKITNNSNYIIFYKGSFWGEVRTKRDAIECIDNLVKYQKLEFTVTY